MSDTERDSARGVSDPMPAGPMNSGPFRSGKRVAPVIVLAVAVVIAAFFVILINAKSGSTADIAYSPLVDGPAPAVKTTTLDGKPFDLQRRKGSWVVLNFFNSTCGPCVQEHPEFVKFAGEQQTSGSIGAEMYSVVWNDIDGATAKFFTKNMATWPVLLDTNAEIGGEFGVAKVPETWIIDPNGYVVWHTISEVTDDSLTKALFDRVATYDASATPGSATQGSVGAGAAISGSTTAASG
jgi:cytochrome c biogenesis protein CcmG/thiol:disulfide interchange protein DsbE